MTTAPKEAVAAASKWRNMTNSLKSVRLSKDTIIPERSDRGARSSSSSSTARSHSAASSLSTRSAGSASDSDTGPDEPVDWDKLDKHEEEEPRAEDNDEATALLLAKLEKENAALAGNPKSAKARRPPRPRAKSRPVSVHQLRKMVNRTSRNSLHFSQLPTMPMTDLDFWAALAADYPQTVQRLPTLTSNKIRGGVPPPLRSVVWPSITGADDTVLQAEYHKLCDGSSPYESLIDKDVGRSFPNVEMFRDKDGQGQQMLARVLKCFSLYDEKIGYCQGLGFVVGPLLMHMNDVKAFCVLVR